MRTTFFETVFIRAFINPWPKEDFFFLSFFLKSAVTGWKIAFVYRSSFTNCGTVSGFIVQLLSNTKKIDLKQVLLLYIYIYFPRL